MNGNAQVAGVERSQDSSQKTLEIVNWVAENCCNPITKQRYTVNMVSSRMQQMGFNVKANKKAKPLVSASDPHEIRISS